MAPPVPPAARGATSSALARHRSAAQLKLETLEKEHERLLRDIARRRASRDITERALHDATSALAARTGPLQTALISAVTELRAIFDRLLSAESNLSRRDKARVRRLYLQLFPELRGASADGRGSADPDDSADSWQSSNPFGSEPEDQSCAGKPEGDAGYSAAKPGQRDTGLLRTLFRRLAVALHPDKVQDATASAELTAVMKQVTCAYESGDLARLVELERTWLAREAEAADQDADQLARRIQQLLSANKDLRRQLRALSAELKDLKQALPVRGGRLRAKGPPDFSSVVDEMVEELQGEVSRLEATRDFAAGFLRGEITLEEFLLGPPMPDDGDESLDMLFAEVIAALAQDDVDEPRSRRRRRGGAR